MNGDLIVIPVTFIAFSLCYVYSGKVELKSTAQNVWVFSPLNYLCMITLLPSLFFTQNKYILSILLALLLAFITAYGFYVKKFPAVKYLLWSLFFISLTPPEFERGIMILSAVPVAVSGSFAEYVSRKFGYRQFSLTSERKTVSGSVAYFLINSAVFFAAATFIKTYTPDVFNINCGNFYLAYSAFVISFIGVFIHAMSSRGANNFFGIIITALLAYIFLREENFTLINNFSLGLFFAVAIAAVSYKLKFLTANGSVATMLLAGFLFGFGGIKWSVPILAFFILSSLLSKFRKKVNDDVETYFEKTGVRDYMQVFANGGLGGIFVVLDLLYQKEIFYLLYISVLAAVCADTWATEIGTLKRTPTYNILNLQRVEQGISGGISLPGISASIIGSAVISLSGIYWIGANTTVYILFVVLAGTVGSLFDSVLGATVQLQHKCSVCSKITEREIHCGAETSYFKGIQWINNDLVNFFAGISGGLIVIFLNAFI